MPAQILAIDIGTSSTKGLLVREDGTIAASHNVAYELHEPQPGHAEQDPEEILAAVKETVARLAKTGVDVVLSCYMHSLLAVDDRGAALTWVRTWADRRCDVEAEELRTGEFGRGLHERTGTPLHPMSPLCKLRHMRRHESAVFSAADRFVSIKEFVLEALTGERCVDHSVASTSGLFDVGNKSWDEQALDLAGIDATRLSALVPTTHVVEDRASDRRVVVGATDGVLANLGVGAAGPEHDMVCITLGTSGAARRVVGTPRTDPEGRLFCYVLDADRWVVGGAINNGGLVLRWLRELFFDAVSADAELIERAAQAPIGASGLHCQPRLTGERYPTYCSRGTGSFVGITAAHHRRHFLRAGIEGVILSFAPLLAELELAGTFREIRIGGGMFAWAFTRQMLADVLGRRVVMSESRESTGLGAARLGFSVLGDAGQADDWQLVFPHVHEPDPGAHAAYCELLEQRRELFPT